MKKKDFISSLQTLFGATKSELIFVAIILTGLLAGYIIRMSSENDNAGQSNSSLDAFYKALDSLAEVEKTTYTGADMHGNKIPELAAGDTVVKDEESYGFPSKKKKSLPSGPVNINTATKSELSTLPGIGKKTAQRIIDYRENHPFRRPKDIMKVKGIGKKKYEKLREYIVVK